MNPSNLINNYLSKADWRVRENANTGYSLQGLSEYLSTSLTADYWLHKIYNEAIATAHKQAQFHIHDLGKLSAYCCGWDLFDIIMRGFGGVSNKLESAPPKHFDTALLQLVNFMYTISGEIAGAVAVSNFDTLLAPFIRYDNLSYKRVKQIMQQFVFNLNVATRTGFQAPFTNITMDLTVPDNLANNAVIIGGKMQDTVYADYQAEMDMLNRAFAEVMYEGDAKGRIFSFPIPTYNITQDFDYSAHDAIWKMTAKYGTPYFANFVNSNMKPSDVRSMCPLTGDTQVIVKSNGNVETCDIEQIIERMKQGETFETLAPNGQWIAAKPVMVEAQHIYEIKLENNETVRMGEYHLQPTSDGIKPAGFLIAGMSLPMYPGGYVKIESVRQYHTYDSLYCFEVESDNHLFVLANGLVTHNCRLRLDNTVLQKRMGGLFASAPLTGSIGVVTINLPQIALRANNEVEFFNILDNLMELAKDSLEIKREYVEAQTERGLYPYSKVYLESVKMKTGHYWGNHFSTIGLNGAHECCLNMYGYGIDNDRGREFILKILDHMRARLLQFQNETGNLYNLEASPAESANYRFARYDSTHFKDAHTSGLDSPYYTNSSQAPVDFGNDIFDILDHQDDIQILYTGGTVQHIFLGERIDDYEQAKVLVKTVCENYELPYFTISPVFSVCESGCGYIPGRHETCPTCGSDTIIYDRVVGYLQPVSNWNDGKQAEEKERARFQPWGEKVE